MAAPRHKAGMSHQRPQPKPGYTITAVEWDQTNLEELDLTSTDLNEEALLYLLSSSPNLNFLSVAYCDGFTDLVFETLINNGKTSTWRVLDVSETVNLNYELVYNFLRTNGGQLLGLGYTGNSKITEQFWISSIKNMPDLKYPRQIK